MAGCSASLSLEEAPELPSSSCWFCLVFFRNTPLLAQARKIKRLAAQHSSQRSRGISWTVLDTSSSVGTAVLCSSCVSCFQWSSECPNCCSTISFNCLTVELTASCSISHDKQAGSRRLVYPLEEQGPRYAFFVMSGRYALPLAHATGRLMSRSTGLVTSCSFTYWLNRWCTNHRVQLLVDFFKHCLHLEDLKLDTRQSIRVVMMVASLFFYLLAEAFNSRKDGWSAVVVFVLARHITGAKEKRH